MSLFSKLLPGVFAIGLLAATPILNAAEAPPTAAQRQQLDPASALNNEAVALYLTGNYRDALIKAKQALAIHERVLGSKHSHTADCMDTVGNILEAMGDPAAARPYLEKTLAVRRTVFGSKHAHTARSLHQLGVLLLAQGELAAARAVCEEELAIYREISGAKHLDTAQALHNLGRVNSESGDYPAAQKLYEQSLAIRRELFGDGHPKTADALNSLGFIRRAQGDYVSARQYYEQALAIRLKAPGIGLKHRDTAISINNLGFLLSAQGDYAAAGSYFQQAVAINTELLGRKHPNTLMALSNLASMQEEMGDYAAARRNMDEALAGYKEVLGPKHADVARLLNNLGGLLTKQGDPVAARELYQQAVEIRKVALGPKHPITATSINNVGYTFVLQCDHAAARPYYEQALAIKQEVLGPDAPSTSLSLHNLALLEAATDNWIAAAKRFGESRRNVRRHVLRVLPGLNDQEQLVFIRRGDRDRLAAALSLGLTRGEDPAIAQASAEWLVNGKAVAQEVLAERELLLRDLKDPQQKALAQELKQIRQELAVLSNVTPQPDQAAAHRERLSLLTGREQIASRSLGLGRGRAVPVEPWIELNQIREGIPDGGVLVDVMRFDPVRFKAAGKDDEFAAARYVAWITRKTGDVAVVDLGEAAAIEKAVAALQAAMQAALGTGGEKPLLAQLGEVDAEQKLLEALRPLGKLVHDPLAPHLKGASEVIVSPDAGLWLAPWAALPVGDDKYAVEQYQFRFVVSPRDLIAGRSAVKTTAGPPNIFANPSYDLTAAEANTATRSMLKPADIAALLFHKLPPGLVAALPKAARLPSTATEAAAITPSLERYANSAPKLYADKQALETVFKTVRSPRVLVLSTHGYFLADQPAKSDPQAAQRDDATTRSAVAADGRPLDNPLLRCGLLLAGCNARGGEARLDDGVLTGLEIIGCELRGTELVVLSACETGLGVVNNGEGVAGLRQAFQMAGARSVVSTLWQIPDKQSAQLMTDFFANLAAGQSKAEALRTAQLAMIKARRDRHGAAHPLFWAAFTVTGN